MATLFNTKISETYPGLIKTIDNTALTATLKELTDGTGNQSGLYANTVGDFKVTSILEFGSLKDTGENIIISKFVDAADGIGNNDNDTTIPTTAAIIDYVAAQITIEDLDFTGDTGSGQIDLDSQIFAIGGTTNEITTVASGQTITFSLDSTGVNLPDNSTAITQTAGDNSTKIATTSYVDTLDAASDLDITDGTNTGDVNLNTQSLSILGTTNEIDSVVSGQSVTIGLPSTINTNLVGNVTGNLTGDVVGDLTGNVTSTSVLANGVTATTQSSSDDSTKVATTAYVKGLNNASDLDFSTDSGSGAVVLNSETLSVIGTTNEIETSGSGQQIQIGLPSSISTNLVGNVTGNLTGNVTGDVTGDLTGNSAGTHTGAVIGNLTGNVTGDLTGNADTATAWETARDLSVTGQASATITGVDGTSNVSASITLDNNSVTSKVLTGLPTPAASSVLATDSIVQGIGKLQSQINGLAGGLRFMGSWDATNNNPSLSSGGGEATSGTTTSTTANKLVDSSASFLTTVTVGDQVINQVDGQNALVSNVDSDTTLSLDNDIMVSGEAYTIDNSPFITQGHYYVVNVGGTTALNGISNWSVGDWVIAGANNEWTKLDHTQIDGTGTGDANDGNIPRFTASNIIGDSIIRETGGNLITVSGTLSTTGNLNAQGDFAINTDKFTTQASTGNTAFAGDLAINTNKFTVNATSGNTVVAGTLNTGAITGTSATIDDITINGSTISDAGNFTIDVGGDISLDSNNGTFRFKDGGTEFGKITENSNNLRIFSSIQNGDILLQGNDGGSTITALTLDMSEGGNATFAGTIDSDNITVGKSDGNNSSISLTSNTGNWTFTNVQSSRNLEISDSDGTGTVMTIDTSGNVGIGNTNPSAFGKFVVQGAGNLLNLNATSGKVYQAFYENGVGRFYLNTLDGSDGLAFTDGDGSTERMRIDSSGNVGINEDNPSTQIHNLQKTNNRAGGFYTQLSGNTYGLSMFVNSGGYGIIGSNGSFTTDILTLDLNSGNVGIGDNNPSEKLHVNSGTGNVPALFESTDNKVYISFKDNDTTSTPLVGGDNNDLIFTTSDTERMRISAAGNVGIGVDPSGNTDRLQINNPANPTSIRIGDNTTDDCYIIFNTDGNDWSIGTDRSDSNKFKISDYSRVGTNDRLTIDSSGNATFGGTGTFASNVVVNNMLTINIDDISTGENRGLKIYNQNSTGQQWNITTGITGVENTSFCIRDATGNVNALTMAKITGNANFAGEISSSDDININNGKLVVNHTSAEVRIKSSSDLGESYINFSDPSDINPGQIYYGHSSNSMVFRTNDNERMRIDTNGVIQLTESGAYGFLNADGTNYEIDINRNPATGAISDSSKGCARIGLRAEDNGAGSRIIFGTASVNNTTATERMRITGGGEVLIRRANYTDTTFSLQVGDQANDSYRPIRCTVASTSTRTQIAFFNTSGNSEIGSISTSGTSTSYNTSSDYRLKEDLQDFAGLDMVSKIPVYDFKWKTDESRSYGVMAHELKKVLPQAVVGDKDAEEMQSVDYSKIVPLLVKSIQELKAEVDLLKQECKCK